MHKILLHEEIRDILIASGNVWMTTREIAAQVNSRNRYRKKDGSKVTSFQIQGRTRNYPLWFKREGSRVQYRGPKSNDGTSGSMPETAPLLAVSDAHPELFHYTSIAALEGMLQTNTMWATNINYLNDSSELELMWPAIEEFCVGCMEHELNTDARMDPDYAEKIDRRGGPEIVAKSEGSMLVGLIRSSIQGEDKHAFFAPPFVASFTTHSGDTSQERYHDSHGMLGQWRGYGGDACIALVFDSSKIETLMEQECERFIFHSAHLNAAIYGGIYLNAETEIEYPGFYQGLRLWLKTRVQGHTDEISQLPALINRVVPMLIPTAVRFKHIAFNEERECRLMCRLITEPLPDHPNWDDVSANRAIKQIHRRTGKFGAVPYIRLFEDSGMELPITRIIIGPSKNQLAHEDTVRKLIGSREIEVYRSQIPFIGTA